MNEFAHPIFEQTRHGLSSFRVAEYVAMLDWARAERAIFYDAGVIAVDEHTTIPCVISELSNMIIRMTMLTTAEVPDSFLLSASCIGSGVCEVVWRTDESIGAHLRRLDS